MKFFRPFLIALALVGASSVAHAQLASITFGDAALDDSQPIEIAANALSLDQAAGVALFTGQVEVVQGGFSIAADQIEVRYEVVEGEVSDQIDTMTATGNVLMTNAGDKATGQTAVYKVGSEQVVMTGNVQLTQGRVALSGQRLVINLTDNSGVIEGRVKTVLQPKAAQ